MVSILLSVPLMGILVIAQSAIVARLPLLNGYPDLILLAITAWALQERVTTAWQWGIIGALLTGYISAIPLFIPLASYLFVVALARFLQRRIWKTPLLAMLVITLLGSFFYYGFSMMVVQLSGVSLSFNITIKEIVIPSVLLNVILAIPSFAFYKEIADFLFPDKDEI